MFSEFQKEDLIFALGGEVGKRWRVGKTEFYDVIFVLTVSFPQLQHNNSIAWH